VSIPDQPVGRRPNADESIPLHHPDEPSPEVPGALAEPAGRGTSPVPAEAEPEPEPVQTQVVVRRSPRYSHFMILGAVLGALAALILTFSFPANPTYDRGQVFGYLLLVGLAVGIGLGALVALILDRVVGRKGTSVIADWVETTPGDAPSAGASPADGPRPADGPSLADGPSPTDGASPRQGDGA